ncbi:MAG: VWA domain-containing protein, partial [Candidatus Competibacterales bacterium]|nr:VWA domain-containing protein [Candidatus Competibacterales bacterium]
MNTGLANKIAVFVRLLRVAGLTVGPGKTLDALRGVGCVGVASREDVYWALHAVLVDRPERHALFDRVFRLFWHNPGLLDPVSPLVPESNRKLDTGDAVCHLLETLRADTGEMADGRERAAGGGWSRREQLRHQDFEQMSRTEQVAAERLLRRLPLQRQSLPTRRYRPDPHGARIDPRATLRGQLRGGSALPPARRNRRQRPPPLVLLCDISGSMTAYTRMLLLFAHALVNRREKVHALVFATRLTDITRALWHRDVDQALARVAGTVSDWSGGTRIGECLHCFNRDWSRRLLSQGALVLLVSDGLDRGDPDILAHETERLHKSCWRLLWLNPLLRYDGFHPRARGIRAMLPHVDAHRAGHNIASLAELAVELRHPGPRRQEPTPSWLRTS